MRDLTKIEIEKLKLLTEKSVEVTLIEPTQVGLEKSIMDATGAVRAYLKDKNIHDYENQNQGPEGKIQVNSYLIGPDSLISSVASLYRPNTKKGDPRIWFKGLGTYATANDVLGIFSFENKLYVVNVTKLDFESLIKGIGDNPLKELVNEINSLSRVVSDELLAMLRKISSQGAIPSLLQADTAIGRTLETLLGIDINSSKQPDYKGIELKAFRDKKRGNRKNLFAQVPDWKKSKFQSSADIVNEFGYPRGDVYKLYCTVSALVRNSQGLKLKMDADFHQLIENSDKTEIGDFVVWQLETLHKRLLEKHAETFWVAADTLIIDGIEHFIYKQVEHTKSPIVSQFDILLEQGIITLDHLIKKTQEGRVVEKGPLFKIKPNSLNLLFPPSQIYNLLNG